MKVRILANSFRFRLKQPEVGVLKAEGKIEEVVRFGASPDSWLTFALEIKDTQNFAVSFNGNVVIFYVPKNVADDWITENKTGFKTEIDIDENRNIKLLVEKDFKCMDACSEDNAGAYEQPFH